MQCNISSAAFNVEKQSNFVTVDTYETQCRHEIKCMN